VILDTGLLVKSVRGRLAPGTIDDQDDVTLPAIVVAEFLTGILGEADLARRTSQRAFLEHILDVTPVDDYTPAVAEHHAALMAHARTTGQPRGAHDLIIAATARATGRLILTTNAKARFDELPEVQARVIL
jgi:tRNA(fMet)-specific endonuclease VapC